MKIGFPTWRRRKPRIRRRRGFGVGWLTGKRVAMPRGTYRGSGFERRCREPDRPGLPRLVGRCEEGERCVPYCSSPVVSALRALAGAPTPAHRYLRTHLRTALGARPHRNAPQTSARGAGGTWATTSLTGRVAGGELVVPLAVRAMPGVPERPTECGCSTASCLFILSLARALSGARSTCPTSLRWMTGPDVLDTLTQAGLTDPALRSNVALAVSEATANAVRHAYPRIAPTATSTSQLRERATDSPSPSATRGWACAAACRARGRGWASRS